MHSSVFNSYVYVKKNDNKNEICLELFFTFALVCENEICILCQTMNSYKSKNSITVDLKNILKVHYLNMARQVLVSKVSASMFSPLHLQSPIKRKLDILMLDFL